jgi:hypothetical protein
MPYIRLHISMLIYVLYMCTYHTTIYTLYMIIYYYAHIRPAHVYIHPGSHTYTNLHTSMPIYVYIFLYIYAHIPIYDYIFLRLYIYSSFHTSFIRPSFILKRPYTLYTCLHTSTSTYLFNCTNFYGDICTYIYILRLPYTYTCLRIGKPPRPYITTCLINLINFN